MEETEGLRGTASQAVLRDGSKEGRRSQIHGFVRQNTDRSPLMKENQTSHANAFGVFLCAGRCKGPGSLESSL